MPPRRRVQEGPPVYDEGKYGPGDTGGKKPIGVPEGYTTMSDRQSQPGYYPHGYNYNKKEWGSITPSTPIEIGARYSEGDEWAPAQLDPASIGELQRQLMAAGLLEAGYRHGVWDDKSVDAYKALLAEANAAGVTAQAQLARRQQSFTIGEGGVIGADEAGNPMFAEFQAPPLQVRTTNKDDLRRVFRTAIIDLLGEGWSQAQIDEMVDAYNWQEIAVQKQAYDAEVARMRAEFYGQPDPAAGETVVEPSMPSPETFVENEARRRDPVGVQAAGVVNDMVPAFMSMMEGWV